MTVIVGLAVAGAIVGIALARISILVPDSTGVSCSREDVSTPVVSLVTAIVWATIGATVGWTIALGPLLVFASGSIALSVVDVVRFRLPDRILFPTLGATLVAIIVSTIGGAPTTHLLPAVIGGLAYCLILAVPSMVSAGGLAFGDVKLALLLGLIVGWMRASIAEAIVLVIYAMMAGMLLGIVSGLLVGVGRRVIGPHFFADPDEPLGDDGVPTIPPLLKTAFPFGPALAAAALIVTVASGSILQGTGLV